MFVDGKNKVCRLRHPIYGLKQSGRAWHKLTIFVSQKLKQIGLNKSKIKPCVYTGKIDNYNVIIVVYVDILLLATKSINVMRKLKLDLSKHFKIKDLELASEILGVQIKRKGDTGSKKFHKESIYTK